MQGKSIPAIHRKLTDNGRAADCDSAFCGTADCARKLKNPQALCSQVVLNVRIFPSVSRRSRYGRWIYDMLRGPERQAGPE